MKNIRLTDKQIQQLIWAIDITENTLEGLSNKELAEMNIEVDRKALFAIADYLEALSGKVGA